MEHSKEKKHIDNQDKPERELAKYRALSTLLILAAYRMRATINLYDKYNPLAMIHPVAQWLERPTGVRKVMGSIPVGDSDFFFDPRSRHEYHIFLRGRVADDN